MKKIEAVIFDWAGTTVDYGCFAPLEVFVEAFKEAGMDITYEEARKPMGLLKIDHVKALLEMERINNLWIEKYKREWYQEDINKIYARFEEILFKNLSNFATPVPGVLDLVKNLRESNIKIGSTTGYTKEMLDIVAENAKLQGYEPDFRITSTEVKGGRPHPYMIQENLKVLNITSLDQVIKIGDTISDIKEGRNAGVWTVGILKGGSELGLSQKQVENMDKIELENLMESTKAKMIEAGAHYVVNEVKDLTKVIEIINNELNDGGKK
nr:phosphonoacetaldehyde hydrolase [uncultured Cetobacterium sp.]